MVTLKAQDSADKALASEAMEYTVYKNLLQLKRLKLIVEQVLANAPAKQSKHMKLLELGCGIGAISFPLSSLGYKVLGVDIDSKSITDCNTRNHFPDAKYAVADAEVVDLGETFDVIVASEIFEHCPHPDKVIKTLDMHLAKGGIGIVTVPNGYCLSEMIFSRLFQKIGIHALFHRLPKKLYKLITGSPTPYYSMNVACHHIHFFSLNKFSKLITDGGFQIINTGNLDLGLFLDWKWLELLKRLECRLADFAPHAIAGGWVFVIKRKGDAR